MFFQHRSSFLLASLLALGLGSCGPSATSPSESQETNNETAEATSEEELQIVTTFLPMTHFTKAVVRDAPYESRRSHRVLVRSEGLVGDASFDKKKLKA